MKNKKWSSILNSWSNGNFPIKPKNINKPFFWKTSVINKYTDLNFYEEFIENDLLINKNQDINTFQEYFNKNKTEKYAISFPNLSGDTTLIVPVPRVRKNFSNLFYFMKNASNKQQSELWKLVVKEALKLLKVNENIWISTHGLGVNYLHIRVSNTPKYYGDSQLQFT